MPVCRSSDPGRAEPAKTPRRRHLCAGSPARPAPPNDGGDSPTHRVTNSCAHSKQRRRRHICMEIHVTDKSSPVKEDGEGLSNTRSIGFEKRRHVERTSRAISAAVCRSGGLFRYQLGAGFGPSPASSIERVPSDTAVNDRKRRAPVAVSSAVRIMSPHAGRLAVVNRGRGQSYAVRCDPTAWWEAFVAAQKSLDETRTR